MIYHSFFKKSSYLVLLITCLFLVTQTAYSAAPKKDFYQLKVYHLSSNEQMAQVDQFLKDTYLPALHKTGVKKIGVFKPLANDTAADKTIYVLIPFSSVTEWMKSEETLEKDAAYKTGTQGFTSTAYDNPPYVRMESILLEAIPKQPQFVAPAVKIPSSQRVYELRSYESPTENLFRKKLQMFNEAGEVDIFTRLGFNAVFYAKVLSGSRMPNLMYMTSFESKESRDAHWKSFGDDPQWKELSAKPEFENKVSVSHIDSILMHPTDYSDI